MSELVEIRCVQSETLLQIHRPVLNGSDVFDMMNLKVRLLGDSLSAEVTAKDIVNRGWPVFFDKLARNWKGWDGPIAHTTCSGNFEISATSDNLGHIALRVSLAGDENASEWEASRTLFVDSGELMPLANRIGELFSSVPDNNFP